MEKEIFGARRTNSEFLASISGRRVLRLEGFTNHHQGNHAGRGTPYDSVQLAHTANRLSEGMCRAHALATGQDLIMMHPSSASPNARGHRLFEMRCRWFRNVLPSGKVNGPRVWQRPHNNSLTS